MPLTFAGTAKVKNKMIHLYIPLTEVRSRVGGLNSRNSIFRGLQSEKF